MVGRLISEESTRPLPNKASNVPPDSEIADGSSQLSSLHG